MIVTVTPNPSLDRTLVLAEPLRHGEVHRAGRARVEASGKGVNVTRVLRARGVESVAVLPSGGSVGAELVALLTVPHVVVPIEGQVRSNISLLDPTGATKINEPGPELTASELKVLVDATIAEVRSRKAHWLAICGSLPPNSGPELVKALVASAGELRVPVAVDSSGPGLRAAVEAGADLIAPNDAELAELTGSPVQAPEDVLAATRELGVNALVSLGARGAILAPVRGPALHAEPPVITVVNPAGAGDALLSGWLATGDLAAAVAWGTDACLVEGTADVPAHGVPVEDVRLRRI
ncbi:PfkB family carbohydrate kinase [Allokutzneria sp. A3M-2-11 16]|uniref:1-phosphofructokinase family hexose kinase n=1 Tax=Allokutzneria sp. A3M-2-11 16 TaxID=2962043 RepID=UPI0020B8710B|nr:PfkB family carbohydrate kinase [Allokutzneria sp. A3M-2-11 16]MCP3804472.1 PfkB family carbohydrate kinase [Allokutzneria sp. A3M-2-11 16]